ncbi:HD domain-containing protein [Bacillus sp. J37]|uniref:HD domain-containing protein n=1 Tax=Bacillus sp. J37 TaxID=935837 RepID=UPI00047928E0|nr:HD domain-containing protein [Bacillus sp. J37]HWK24868.1 HD domain-containing protein [Ureibacillus sp.]
MEQQLLQRASYLNNRDKDLLLKAMVTAKKAHDGQFRKSGEPYIIHPYAVTNILLDYKVDVATLIGALLHDVVEDTEYTLEAIQHLFGEQITTIVHGLTKIDKNEVPEKEKYEAVNFRNMLVAAQEDIRVVVIKVADRLHNMRTLQVKRVKKQVPYASETLKIFTPFCKKLGLLRIQAELEDLSYAYLHNGHYTQIKSFHQNCKELFNSYANRVRQEFQKASQGYIDIDSYTIHDEVEPLYTAMTYPDIIDHIGQVVISVPDKMSCYSAMGIVHQLYKPVSSKFIDYIAIQSHPFHRYLRTTVDIDGNEVVICIQDMESKEIRDKGICFFLTEHRDHELQTILSKILGEVIPTNKAVTEDPLEFLNFVSHELLGNQITVFTPKLDVIHLPNGATAIDFAFAVDAEKAKHMAVVRINGKIHPVSAPLSQWDIVEILISQYPGDKSCWLHFASTSKAQLAIRKELGKE